MRKSRSPKSSFEVCSHKLARTTKRNQNGKIEKESFKTKVAHLNTAKITDYICCVVWCEFRQFDFPIAWQKAQPVLFYTKHKIKSLWRNRKWTDIFIFKSKRKTYINIHIFLINYIYKLTMKNQTKNIPTYWVCMWVGGTHGLHFPRPRTWSQSDITLQNWTGHFTCKHRLPCSSEFIQSIPSQIFVLLVFIWYFCWWANRNPLPNFCLVLQRLQIAFGAREKLYQLTQVRF